MTPRTFSNTSISETIDNPVIPKWAEAMISSCNNSSDHERLVIGEWDEDGYDCTQFRNEGGWQGTDFIHSRYSAVRILCYFAKFQSECVGTSLKGVVYYSPAAESHAGYCHGGEEWIIYDLYSNIARRVF